MTWGTINSAALIVAAAKTVYLLVLLAVDVLRVARARDDYDRHGYGYVTSDVVAGWMREDVDATWLRRPLRRLIVNRWLPEILRDTHAFVVRGRIRRGTARRLLPHVRPPKVLLPFAAFNTTFVPVTGDDQLIHDLVEAPCAPPRHRVTLAGV